MDGANASTTFRDDAGRTQKGVQANGNAQMSTAQSKFGGASALFDGSGDFLTVPHNNAFDLGTGDFTIEFWVRSADWTTSGVSYALINETTSFYLGYYKGNFGSGDVGIILYQGGDRIYTGFVMTNNTWQHIALVRSSGSTKVYVDGTQQGNTFSGDTTTYNFNTPVYIANDPGGNRYFNGYLDEIRISNTARYTANFTPSTTPFQNDDNTVLLLHMDGTNASTVFFDDNGVKPYTP
jgi:hypothetical protein